MIERIGDVILIEPTGDARGCVKNSHEIDPISDFYVNSGKMITSTRTFPRFCLDVLDNKQ